MEMLLVGNIKNFLPAQKILLTNTLGREISANFLTLFHVQQFGQSDLSIDTGLEDKKTILNRPLGRELDLKTLIAKVAQHYIKRALNESHNNKTEAAELIGLPSYQTLNNWMEKYDVNI